MSFTHDKHLGQKAQAIDMGQASLGLNIISLRDELLSRQKGLQDAANRNIEGANAIRELLDYMAAHPDAADMLERVHKLARF